MNSADAAYHTVHDYNGGAEALAPSMGMSPAILRGKVLRSDTKHHLTLREASRLMGLTEDYRILHALAAEHGFVLRAIGDEASGDITAALLAAMAAKGDLAQLVAEVLEDRVVTPNEAAKIAKQCAAVQTAVVEVSRHAAAAASAGMPKPKGHVA